MKAKLVTFLIFLFLAGLTGMVYGETAIVKADGSSTVFPISAAMAEEFQKAEKGKIRVTVGLSGTGGGFKKFCRGETDISDASRPIKESEAELCKSNNIKYIEIPVAYDGIAVVVNPKNTWVKDITVSELKKIWEPEAQAKISKWNQVRASWPDKEIHLFGLGVDSGTYDYFTEATVGKEHSSRGDYTSSADPNVLVQGISSDVNALGFFGVAYYENNKDKLKLVPVINDKKGNSTTAVLPTYDNVLKGVYQPLSRPIFIYVSVKSAEKPEIQKFVTYYLKSAPNIVKEVGYISLPATAYPLGLKRFEKRMEGSVFGGHGSQIGVKIEDLLQKESK
ncbi:MAG: PstS family phosphate ABC transporter substrate-binding protein [Nitrospirae bacterium]|nr:PstS family phosphate ABC transporter substrate-binding protein [Nitrospirota bacterium]